MPVREAWLAVRELGDQDQETEVVTLTGVQALEGGTIETTDGLRITLVEPATVRDPVGSPPTALTALDRLREFTAWMEREWLPSLGGPPRPSLTLLPGGEDA